MICELKATVQLNLRTPFFPDNVRDVSGTKYLCFIHTFCTPSDDRSKKRRKLKRSRRFHKHEVEEEVKCASSASDSDESLGTFCDRYERKQKTKKGMFVYFRNI